MEKIQLKGWIVSLGLVAGGLLLILVGTWLDGKKLELHLPNILISVGEFLAVVAVVHFLFDLTMRKELFREVAAATLKYTRVADSGIRDFRPRSKEVDYRNIFTDSEILIIGQNYSPRIVDDFTDQLKSRTNAKRPTRIVIVDPECEAFRFLQAEQQNSDHMVSNSGKIVSAIEEMNRKVSGEGDAPIRIIKTKKLLRYSFVYTEKSVWVKPYRNSTGRTSVYALEIEKNSPLYEFYDRDIRDLLKESGDSGI